MLEPPSVPIYVIELSKVVACTIEVGAGVLSEFHYMLFYILQREHS
jgi:hypothetical protein